MATDSSRLDVLRRRVQLDPASIAFAPLAEELRRAGEHYEAVKVCLAGLEHHPAFLSARVTLGRALAALDQHQEARTEFEYVLKAAPDNLLASRSLAELEAQCLEAAPQPNPSLEELEAWLARIEADRAERASHDGFTTEPISLASRVGAGTPGQENPGGSGGSAPRNPRY